MQLLIHCLLQFTVEKLGRADSVTSYDDQFESLSSKIDQIKLNTERIISTLESMIQPNPSTNNYCIVIISHAHL